MDTMPHQQGPSKFGIMSIAIDANSRAPFHLSIPISHSPRSDNTNDDDTRSFDAVSDTLTTATICSEEENQVPLVHCSSRSNEKPSDANHERNQRSKIHRLSTDFKTRVSKIRRQVITETHEARETYLLLETCRKSSLARKVRKGSEGKLRTTRPASRKPSSTPRPASTPQPCSVSPQDSCTSGITQGVSPESTPQDSRKASIGILSFFSDISSRKSSTTTVCSSSSSLPSSSNLATITVTPIRQRKISAPLEHNPAFHPRQLSQSLETHRNCSTSSTAPVFRIPVYTPPTIEDCTACEILRIVPHGDIDEEEALEESMTAARPRFRILRRLSDERGNSFIEEVRNIDRNGKKKVLLQWGKDVDVIIPPVPTVETSDDEVAATESRFKSRLRASGRAVLRGFKGVKERVQRAADAANGDRSSLFDEVDDLWERYP